MKPARSAVAAAALYACGGTSADISNFTGAAWSVNETISDDCQGQTASGSSVDSIAFGAANGGIAYTSNAGCDYKFSVSGDVATLSDAPVTCSTTEDGGTTIILVVQSYTATSPDGVHLTTIASGTLTSAGITCTYSADGSGTR